MYTDTEAKLWILIGLNLVVIEFGKQYSEWIYHSIDAI